MREGRARAMGLLNSHLPVAAAVPVVVGPF